MFLVASFGGRRRRAGVWCLSSAFLSGGDPWVEAGELGAVDSGRPLGAVRLGFARPACAAASFILMKMVGGSAPLLRRRRAEVADLEPGAGFGVCPRPMCHKVEGFVFGEPLPRSAKLLVSEGTASGSGSMVLRLLFLRWLLRRHRSQAASSGLGHMDSQGPSCYSCSLGVLCVKCGDSCVSSLFCKCAYVSCTSAFSA